ncbi:MAG TPA: hypothetical protein VJP05_11250 [Acidimicrobiia bacterium]|nr:hypothetical protein [Acidimicrobiia bacterium]
MNSKQASGLTIVGGLLMAVGSFLTWVAVTGDIADLITAQGEQASTTGIAGGDGWFSLVIGVVLVAVGYMAFSGKSVPGWLTPTAAVLGVAFVALEYFTNKSDIDDLNSLISISGLDGSAGWAIGYWVVAAGSIVALVGAFMSRGKKTA